MHKRLILIAVKIHVLLGQRQHKSVLLSEIEILPSPQPSILVPSTVIAWGRERVPTRGEKEMSNCRDLKSAFSIWKTVSLVKVKKIMTLKLTE